MSSPMVPMAPGPMTVGRILDRIWAIVRGRVGLFTAIGAVPMGVTLACMGLVFGILFALGDFPLSGQPPQDPRRAAGAIFLAMGIVMVPMMAVFAIYQAASCHAAVAVNRGISVTWDSAYGAAWSKAGRYVWLMVLCWLIVSAPLLVLMALFVLAGAMLSHAGSGNVGAWFVLLPMLLLCYAGSAVYMIWMTLRLGLAYPACVAEDITAMEAIKRSGRLTYRAKGRMFLVLLVVYAISYAGILVLEMVGMGGGAILALIGSAMHLQIKDPMAIFGLSVMGLVIAAAIFLCTSLTYSAYAVSLSILYEDQVPRIDGPAAGAALAGGGPA